MRRSSGFTLIELLVVIGILSILMVVLIPNIVQSRQRADEFACQANLTWFYQSFQTYSSRHRGRLPKESGIHMLWALWGTGAVEHTAKNRDRFFCPAVKSEDRDAVEEIPIEELWRTKEDFSSRDTDYAVIAKKRRMDSGKTPWICDDNEGQRNHLSGVINVLMGDGTVKILLPDEDLKEWYDTEDEDFVFPVGPDSPHPLLQKMTTGQ